MLEIASHTLHVYSSKNALLSETTVDNTVTLIVSLRKIAFSDFGAIGGRITENI